MRTIPLLSGLAILGVILNHSNWHVLKTFNPGDPSAYPFIVIDQYGKLAIAAFLFIAGYFAAYATSGGKRPLSWTIVRSRIIGLLWPWMIWSVLMTIGQSFQGRPLSIKELISNLFVQYYFIPLLIVGYLLAPYFVQWAKNNVKKLLFVAALLQLVSIAIFYLRVYWESFPPVLDPWVDIGPLLYLRFSIYFPFGISAGMYPKKVSDTLSPIKSFLPWLALFFYGLAAVEAIFAYELGAAYWPRGNDQTKLTSALFSITFILCFLAFNRIQLPYQKLLKKLGTRSYGLYLSHYVILGVWAKLVVWILPEPLSSGWIVLPLLFFGTAAFAMLLMEFVSRSPIKRLYPYIFG